MRSGCREANEGGIVGHVLGMVWSSIELGRLNCSNCVLSERRSRLGKYDYKPGIPELFCSKSVIAQPVWNGRGLSYIFHPEELVAPVWSDGPSIDQHLLQRGQLHHRLLLLLRRIRIRPRTRRSLLRRVSKVAIGHWCANDREEGDSQSRS